jgi:hypothetical protein
MSPIRLKERGWPFHKRWASSPDSTNGCAGKMNELTG